MKAYAVIMSTKNYDDEDTVFRITHSNPLGAVVCLDCDAGDTPRSVWSLVDYGSGKIVEMLERGGYRNIEIEMFDEGSALEFGALIVADDKDEGSCKTDIYVSEIPACEVTTECEFGYVITTEDIFRDHETYTRRMSFVGVYSTTDEASSAMLEDLVRYCDEEYVDCDDEDDPLFDKNTIDLHIEPVPGGLIVFHHNASGETFMRRWAIGKYHMLVADDVCS